MQRSNSSQQQQSKSIQNCGNLLTSDASANVAGNAQTANHSIASVRNQTVAENIPSSISPQKEIKGSSGSLDISSSNTAREMKGRPIILLPRCVFKCFIFMVNLFLQSQFYFQSFI